MKDQPIIRTSLVLGLALWGAAASPARGHGVMLRSQQMSAIEIQAIYDSGEPLANAQVKIYSSESPAEPWQTGMTDAEGRFIFVPAQERESGTWDVQVRAAGHGGSLSIPATIPASISPLAPQEVESVPVVDPFAKQTHQLTGLQLVVVVGAIIWGCIGTALFFSRTELTPPTPVYSQQSPYQHPSK